MSRFAPSWWIRVLGLALPGAMLWLLTSAAGAAPSTLQLHGFATQGVVSTNRNEFFGPSSETPSFQFTEIGVNASLRPRPSTLIAAQLISRRAGGERRDAQPRIDYALLDQQMQAGLHGRWGVRVGRAKNPFGLYNETRDVAFTRPGILLPQSIYFDRTRSLALSSDGVATYADWNLPSGDLILHLGVGRPQTGEDVEWATLGRPEPGEFKGETSIIGQVKYEHDGGRVIAALSAANTRARFDSAQDGPGDADFRFQPWILSLQYNAEHWQVTAEYARRALSLSGLDIPQRDFDITGESAFLQYTHRLSPEWTWRLRHDVLYTDRDDRAGTRFAASTGLPAHTRFAKDWTTGLEWRPHPQVMLAVEYHRVDGTAWLPGQDNPDPRETSRHWDMWLGQVSVRF